MRLADVILPRLSEATDVETWAKLLIAELERTFAAQETHVGTQALPMANLPSAVKPGILITVLDDSVHGVCLAFSNGTAWIRAVDNTPVA